MNTDLPLISIIIPCYKVEKFLSKCVNSTLQQTYKNLEIILIDDGSPDNTGILCDKLSILDPRIKVIHKKNGGLSSARNVGVRTATGEWVMFLDGDDWIEPKMCESMLDEIQQRSTLDLVMCSWVRDFNGHLQYYTYEFNDKEIFVGEQCKKLMGQMLNFKNYIGDAVCKLIRRDLLIENNIFHREDLRQGVEGIYFSTLLFDKIKEAIFINKPFYHYVYNNQSITSIMTEQTINLLTKGYDAIHQIISTKEDTNYLQECFSSRVLSGIISASLRGIMNPFNTYTWKKRIQLMSALLDTEIIQYYIHQFYPCKDLTYSKNLILYILTHKYYRIIYMIAVIRNIQLHMKNFL